MPFWNTDIICIYIHVPFIGISYYFIERIWRDSLRKTKQNYTITGTNGLNFHFLFFSFLFITYVVGVNIIFHRIGFVCVPGIIWFVLRVYCLQQTFFYPPFLWHLFEMWFEEKKRVQNVWCLRSLLCCCGCYYCTITLWWVLVFHRLSKIYSSNMRCMVPLWHNSDFNLKLIKHFKVVYFCYVFQFL